MPVVYSITPATAGNLTTNATPNTETDAFFIKPGSSRCAALTGLYLIGKAAALTSISGIAMRLCSFATASTAGTGMTPKPKDSSVSAATATSASRPTAGATRTNRILIGCGAAGPGQWVARTDDAAELLPAGSAASIDGMDVSGTASLNYEFSAEFQE